MTLDLQEHFGAVRVISLRRCTQKLARFRTRARKAGVKGISHFPAVDGRDFPSPFWWSGTGLVGSDGSWACLLSHLAILQETVAAGASSVLVFEDDCVFANDFAERLPDLMKSLGDNWDMLYLGGEHWLGAGLPERDPARPGLLRAYSVVRTHAYAVNARIISRVHQHLSHYPDYGTAGKGFHIDHQLALLHSRKDTIVRAVHPWLCGQGANDSEVNGRTNPEQWWHIKERYLGDPPPPPEVTTPVKGKPGVFKGKKGIDPFAGES